MGVSGIELFFKRYFGNFDFNVRYCGIIQPCGMRFFIPPLAKGIRYKRRSFTVLRYRSFGFFCLISDVYMLEINKHATTYGYNFK